MTTEDDSDGPSIEGDLRDVVVERMKRSRMLRQGLRSAIANSTVTTDEASVMELLSASTAEDYDELRACFEHGVKSVDYRGLTRAKLLMHLVANAIIEDDAATMNHVIALMESLVGLGSERMKVLTAYADVETALSSVGRGGTALAAASKMLFLLEKLDPLFAAVTNERAAEILTEVAASKVNVKGGTAPGTVATLAELMTRSGAFCTSNKTEARKKIRNAKPPRSHDE